MTHQKTLLAFALLVCTAATNTALASVILPLGTAGIRFSGYINNQFQVQDLSGYIGLAGAASSINPYTVGTANTNIGIVNVSAIGQMTSSAVETYYYSIVSNDPNAAFAVVPVIISGAVEVHGMGSAKVETNNNIRERIQCSGIDCQDVGSPILINGSGLAVNYELHTSIGTDQIGFITLEAVASQYDGGPLSTASADPLIYIDPTFANASSYSIQFSQNAAVPVPSAIWMFCSALLGVIGFSQRKSAHQKTMLNFTVTHTA